MPRNMEIDNGDETIRIDFETRKVIIHDRYENLHILNDLLLALWFLVGSIMFFYKHWTYWGTWLFVLGSAQMALGPLIRVSHKLHLRRFERVLQNLGHHENFREHENYDRQGKEAGSASRDSSGEIQDHSKSGDYRDDGLW